MNKSVFLLVAFLLSPQVFAEKIYVISENQKGEEVLMLEEKSFLVSEMKKASQYKQDVLVSTLENLDSKSSFKLKKISLGLALEGEAGIGPFNVGMAIKHRVFFEKESK